jgi:PEGA domain-containing protein
LSLRSFCSFLLCFTLLAVAPLGVAHAQDHGRRGGGRGADKGDKETSEAARLKRDGDNLMDQDKYVDALALYARAHELSGDPALLYNQGRALEAMGEYPEAIDKLERFEREASPALRAKVPGLRELMADLRGRIGTVIITTNTPGARLFVRERAAGTLQPETRVRTRSGPATVEVVAEGMAPFKKDVDLPGGGTVTVQALLVAKKVDSILVVRTHPNANISLDQKALGRSPLEVHVPPGSHVMAAHAEGHEDERVPMSLAGGERREVDLELKKPPGLLAKWWFWTGIGLVVAGGVATYIVLTTERPPETGTFGNGRTTGP